MPSFTSTPFAYTSWQRFGLWLLVSLLVTTGLYQGASTVDYPAYGEAAKTLMKPEFARFTFDPNKVSATELRELGLSERQAGAWIKFRGGRSTAFRRPQDIGRLYVLTDEQKTRLIALAIVNNGDGAQVQAKVVNSKKDRPKKLRPLLGVHFDPNTIPEDSLRLFGFPAYQARALIRYRGDRTTTFRKPTDLFRINSLDSNLVAALLPYVSIAPSASNPAPARRRPTLLDESLTTGLAMLDINLADTTALKSLPGIGSYRAGRIIRFREALGGFTSLAQIGATYGLPDSTFQAVKAHFLIGPILRKIPLNTADERQLRSHPYINRKLARAVVRYRGKHGPFAGPEDLADIRTLRPEDLQSLLPYLSFQ